MIWPELFSLDLISFPSSLAHSAPSHCCLATPETQQECPGLCTLALTLPFCLKWLSPIFTWLCPSFHRLPVFSEVFPDHSNSILPLFIPRECFLYSTYHHWTCVYCLCICVGCIEQGLHQFCLLLYPQSYNSIWHVEGTQYLLTEYVNGYKTINYSQNDQTKFHWMGTLTKIEKELIQHICHSKMATGIWSK